jgi:hypothetical protein
MKVSLYIRNHSTRRYELTKLSTIYPMGTIFVLRYGTTWETLLQATTFIEHHVECLDKQSGSRQEVGLKENGGLPSAPSNLRWARTETTPQMGPEVSLHSEMTSCPLCSSPLRRKNLTRHLHRGTRKQHQVQAHTRNRSILGLLLSPSVFHRLQG